MQGEALAGMHLGPDPLPDAARLLDLPPGILTMIFSRVALPAIRSFAATSTAALKATLEECPRVVNFHAHAGLAARLEGLAFSRDGRHAQRPRVVLKCRLLPGKRDKLWNVVAPIQHLPLLCTELCRATVRDPYVHLSPGALRIVTQTTHVSGAARLPPGMAALELIVMKGGDRPLHVADGWLPNSSAGSVLNLDISCSTVHALPNGLTHLQNLSVVGCMELSRTWLPRSVAKNLRSIAADGVRLPLYLCQ